MLEHPGQCRLERGQIGRVASPVRQADVERPGRLHLGVVGLLVHREREDAARRRRRWRRCHCHGGRRGRRRRPGRRAARANIRRMATATSLNRQKPSPWPANAWWKPPPTCAATRSLSVEGQAGGGRGCRRSSAGSPRRLPACRESRAGRGLRGTGCRGARRRGSRWYGPAPGRPNRPARARSPRPAISPARARRSATRRYLTVGNTCAPKSR